MPRLLGSLGLSLALFAAPLAGAEELAVRFYPDRVALQGEILATGARGVLGNSVTVEHAGGEFSHYAHLLPGSVRVKKGDAVKKGQPIARLGHSGSSTEPHLHFQVTDGADSLLSAGIPVRFSNLEIVMADGPRAPQTGDVVEARP